MAVVNAPAAVLFRRARALYMATSNSLREQILTDRIAERISSDSDKESYLWLGDAPRMQLLKDELQMAGLTDATYEVENDTYAIGLRIKRNAISDDKEGLIMRRVRDMARVATLFPNRLLFSALTGGTTNLGYDGVSFFNDSHPDRGAGSVQDNLLAGTGTTTAQVSADIQSAIVSLMSSLSENGEPLNDFPTEFTLIAPPALMRSVNEALFATIVSNTSNVGFNGFKITPLFSPRLSDANDWYLLDTSPGASRSLIFQEREGVQFEELGEGTPNYVIQEEYIFKVRWRGAVGYGHWGHAVKVVNA